MPGIFISYRRSDNPDAVGRIYDRLVSEFGKAQVFKDVDSIPLGQDFRGHLNELSEPAPRFSPLLAPGGRTRETPRGSGAWTILMILCESSWKLRSHAMFRWCQSSWDTRPCLARQICPRRWRRWCIARQSKCGRIRIFITTRRDWWLHSREFSTQTHLKEHCESHRTRNWVVALAAIMFVSGLGLAIASWYGMRSRPCPKSVRKFRLRRQIGRRTSHSLRMDATSRSRPRMAKSRACGYGHWIRKLRAPCRVQKAPWIHSGRRTAWQSRFSPRMR